MSKFLTLDKVINFITCVGASIVIFGALMKITHKESADLFLTIGLITESGIFLMYAFLPPATTEKSTLTTPIELNEIMPKRSNSNDINIAINQDEVARFNKNLADVNTSLEKLKNVFK
jgi:gliding motility-associated protein GldL